MVAVSHDVSVPPSEVKRELDGSLLELYELDIRPPRLDFPSGKVLRQGAMAGKTPEELGTLLSLFKLIFVDHYRGIRFGPCIEGAVFELELREPPSTFSLLDGYLTVVIPPGPAHFHVCIGEHRGLGKFLTPEALARIRPCRRAVLYRSFSPGSCAAISWGLRFWNGAGEQQLTVFLPSPFLDDDSRPCKPDWSRLELWNTLRRIYLGERSPQPLPELDRVMSGERARCEST